MSFSKKNHELLKNNRDLVSKILLLFCSLSLFICSSCSTSDDGFTPTLPAITQTGANTFGVFIDGKLLTPRDGTGTFNSPDRGMRMIAGGIPPEITNWEINIRDFKSGTGGLLTLHIQDLHQNGEGTYIINESNCEDGIDGNPTINIRCRWWDEASQDFKWYCSIENSRTLTITRYDFENRIVSGIFSCTAKNRDNPNEIIEITQGRFDIKWDAIPSFP